MSSYKLHKIQDFSNREIIDLLKYSLSLSGEPDELRKNYAPDYEYYEGNLFYLLKNGRYYNGAYYVLTTELGEYVGSAGWNQHDRHTALVMTRMYVNPLHRTSYILGLEVLPKILNDVKKYKRIWMTMNHYNKSLYAWFLRKEQKENSGIANWPESYKKFSPLGIRVVNGVDQFVVEMVKGKYMTKEEKLALLIEGIAEISGTIKEEVSLTESTKLSDLKLDSLDIVELQMFYEDQTGTMIPDTTKPLVTVGDLLELLP